MREYSVIQIGLGNVGLFQAIDAHHVGFAVAAVESDGRKFDLIQAGQSYISDIPSEWIRDALATDRFCVYSALNQVPMTHQPTVFSISLPTPLGARGIDYCIFERAIDQVLDHARATDIILVRSSVTPSVVQRTLLDPLAARRPAALRPTIAVAPERMNVGSRILDDPALARVLGITDTRSRDAVMEMFSAWKSISYVTDWRSALMSKILENAFRFVNISLVNEFLNACELEGAPLVGSIEMAATKPFGFMSFQPTGYIGGSATQLAVRQLEEILESRDGFSESIATAALTRNQIELSEAFERVRSSLTSIDKKLEIVVAGVGYKPGYGDSTDSTGFHMVRYLVSLGFRVMYWDPLVDYLVVDGMRVGRRCNLSRSAYPEIFVINTMYAAEPDVAALLDDPSSVHKVIRM